jgi:hypothetical protein
MQLERTMDSTIPQFHEYVRTVRTDDVSAWISFHEDDQRWHVIALARAKGGVYHFAETYGGDQPGVTRVIRHARSGGRFSVRPVRMGQYFDPSMTHGAFALLRRWCDRRQLDMRDLVSRAYPSEPVLTLDDLDEITTQAKWEGIVYPRQWPRTLSDELATALFEVGYRRLASVFVKVLNIAQP